MRVPSTYAHADKLGADGRAALAGAWLVWRGLTPHMRLALRSAWGSAAGLCVRRGIARAPTISALIARGLIVNRHGLLTPLGLLVREAGTRSPKETTDGT